MKLYRVTFPDHARGTSSLRQRPIHAADDDRRRRRGSHIGTARTLCGLATAKATMQALAPGDVHADVATLFTCTRCRDAARMAITMENARWRVAGAVAREKLGTMPRN